MISSSGTTPWTSENVKITSAWLPTTPVPGPVQEKNGGEVYTKVVVLVDSGVSVSSFCGVVVASGGCTVVGIVEIKVGDSGGFGCCCGIGSGGFGCMIGSGVRFGPDAGFGPGDGFGPCDGFGRSGGFGSGCGCCVVGLVMGTTTGAGFGTTTTGTGFGTITTGAGFGATTTTAAGFGIRTTGSEYGTTAGPGFGVAARGDARFLAGCLGSDGD